MDTTAVLTEFSKLPDNLKQEVADFIAFLNSRKKGNEMKKERKFGAARGMFIMSPDFDEPLEDFKDYM